MIAKIPAGLLGDFDKDVPEHIQSDIMERLVEAAWGMGSVGPDISIGEVERRNALNIEFTGTIEIEGVEHSFHIRDGDMAGTEILSWNEDAAIYREAPVIMTLVPQQSSVGDAIFRGQAGKLLQDWDAALNPSTEAGARLSKLPGAAAYDAYFAPGTGASYTHYQAARAAGYEIEEMDAATRVRATLLGAAFSACPASVTGVDALTALQDWKASLAPGTAVSLVHDKVIAAIAERGASEPRADDQGPLQAEGYTLRPRAAAIALRTALTRSLLSLEALEDFDPADLPENPLAVLFHRLDPALVDSTRIDPVLAGAALLDSLARRMAIEESLALPPDAQAQAGRIGFRIANLADAEPVPDLDLDMLSP